MSCCLSKPQVGIIIDAIYNNSQKPKFEQKSLNLLSKDCGVSVNTLSQVRTILVSMQSLIVEGERRNQKCYWNPCRSLPNPAMLDSVYRAYTKDIKSRVKVIKKESKRLPSFDSALQALVKCGYTRVILVSESGNKKTVETYDFSTK